MVVYDGSAALRVSAARPHYRDNNIQGILVAVSVSTPVVIQFVRFVVCDLSFVI